jgi:porphobilinogen synthase
MYFPVYRPRRLRSTPELRELVRETRLTLSDLIQPLFVVPGRKVNKPMTMMPGVSQMSVDVVAKEASKLYDLGIPSLILFGIPEVKDAQGSSACDPKGPVQLAIKAIKKAAPSMVVMTDVCLCEYTTHGHCGLIEGDKVLNDPTCGILAAEALSHAVAGADLVAPSDMMDGRVAAIREILDENGFDETPIMAYAAKYASAFYGPFREAAESTPQFGDRRSYQMDPGNAAEALREVELDIEEGADIVMVKPALPYLDIVKAVKETFNYPTAAYNVSGEYAMIKAGAKLGWIDGDRVMAETLLSIKRAGADLILTYFAKECAQKKLFPAR